LTSRLRLQVGDDLLPFHGVPIPAIASWPPVSCFCGPRAMATAGDRTTAAAATDVIYLAMSAN